jgi:hypothetical protein
MSLLAVVQIHRPAEAYVDRHNWLSSNLDTGLI